MARSDSMQLFDRVRRHGTTAVGDSLLGAGGFVAADLLRFGTHVQFHSLALSAGLLICLFGLANYYFGLHRRIWRYANLEDLWAVGSAVAVSTAAFSLIDFVVQEQNRTYWLSTVPSGAVLAFLLLLIGKLSQRLPHRRALRRRRPGEETRTRVLIAGAGDTGTMLARDFQLNHGVQSQVVGFVDDDPAKLRMRLNGVPVLGTRHDISHLVDALRVDLIAIAIPSSSRAALNELIALCQSSASRVQIVPSLSEIATQGRPATQLRELDVSDLLGREEVHLDVAACAHYIRDQTVLVTGAAGSIGAELCRQLIGLRPQRLVLLDTNETGLFDLHADLRTRPGGPDVCALCIADITDEDAIMRVFDQRRPQVVFHAAAYKHVPLLEEHPDGAVKTNVLGTAVLCRAADAYGVERFVLISSDKAAAAANNLGYSKRIGELLMRAYAQGSNTIFCAVRFGNVIGSRGSVIPTFERQIERGGPVTVTDPAVTRFFMSIPEAACLVIEAASRAVSGSIYMLDMGEPVRIMQLAEKMIRLRGLRVEGDVAITFTGLRRGEKMHEVLTSDLETTVSTAHEKVNRVVDRRPVSRPALESIVRLMVMLTRQGDLTRVSGALRAVSEGQPLAVPAFVDRRRPAGARLTAEPTWDEAVSAADR